MKHLRKITALLLSVMLLLSASAGMATSLGGAPEPGFIGEDFISTFSQDIGTLNYLVTNKSVDADAIAISLDPLIIVNRFGELEPGMALSWEQSEDGLKWTFHLRPGIQWQRVDGSEYGAEVTAQDFVDAIEYILDPKLASFTVDFVLEFIEGAQDYYDAVGKGEEADFSKVGVKALDTYTLEYTTTGVYPFIPSLMTYSCFLPICKQFVEEIGGIDAFGTTNENFLYYGEFLFQTWDQGQLWEFVRNPAYYQADRVHINKISYVYVEDIKVELEMYKRGELTAARLTGEQVDLAMADPELSPYVFRTAVNAASYYYYFNIDREETPENLNLRVALNNENFRLAVLSAINREALTSVTVLNDPKYMLRNTLNIWNLSTDENGKDYMTYGNLPKYEAEGFDFCDPVKAKAYMDKAVEELGDTVSWPVQIDLSVTTSENGVKTSNLLKQAVEETLGVEYVKVEFAEGTPDQYYEQQQAGAFDLTNGGWIPDYADPACYLEINMSDGYIGSMAGFGKLGGFAEFDRLMKEGKSKGVLSERFELFAQAEEYLIDKGFVLPYRAAGGNYAINNVQNPYYSMANIPYGLCNSMFLDLYYGTEPLTLEQREELREQFEQERAGR